MCRVGVLCLGLLLTAASGAPPLDRPSAQARSWIHHAKEVEEELRHPSKPHAHRARYHPKPASLLSEKATAGKAVLLSKLGAAEQAIQQELTKDHAPQALKHQEYELLSKAMDVVHYSPTLGQPRQHKKHNWAARRAGFIQKLQSKELRQKATTQVSTAEELRRSGVALDTYVKGMGKEVRDERKLLSMSKKAKHEAATALAEMHVDSKTQAEVASLLEKTEGLEKKELKLETKDLASSRAEARQFKKFAKRALKAEAVRKSQN